MKKALLYLLILFSVLSLSCTHRYDDLQLAESLVKNRPDSALVLLQRTDLSASPDKKLRNTWHLLDSWAKYNAYRKDYDLENMEAAVEYFLSGSNKLRRAQAYYVRGCVQLDLNAGDPSCWVEDFLRGCNEVEKTDDYNLAALLHLRYAAAISERKWYDESTAYNLEAIEYAKLAGTYNHQVTALINISHNYMFKGDENKDYSEAIKWGIEACRVAKESGNNDMYSRALYSLSSCYSRSGKHSEALECAKEAVAVQENLFAQGKRRDRVRYTALADAYRKLGNADSALFYARKDYDHPSIVTRMSAVQLIYITYRDLLGDDKMSVKYMTEYQQLRVEYESTLQTEKISQSHVGIEKEVGEKAKSSVMKIAMWILLAMAIAVGTVLSILRKRLHYKDSQMKRIEKEVELIGKDLAEKEQEKQRVTSVLIDKDELVMSIRENPHYLNDKQWETLIGTIDKVYDGLCTELSSSGLTQGNIRLACLIKLGISTSDAAIILGISPSSVTKAKQRLKSKLQLPMST